MNERGILDLIIIRLPKLSVREKIFLSEMLESETDLIRKSQSDIEHIINRKIPSLWNLDAVRKQAVRDAETARLREIKWVALRDSAYPPLLREIYDPPLLLFYRGRLPNPELPLAGIVGTRKPCPRSAAQAYDIAKELGQSGISVVSGLAKGIDAMAHRGNIDGGASTVAVLGSGADVIYPLTNRQLARRILETGGAVLTEYPPGTSPYKWNFPARNRIISGLSRGVLIAEAPQKSGSLITAGFALEQNRELWVASAGTGGNDGNKVFDRRGTEKLAEDGAQVINSASDILTAWNIKKNVRESEHIAGGPDMAASLAHSLGISI